MSANAWFRPLRSLRPPRRPGVLVLAVGAALLGLAVGQAVWSDRLTGAWWYQPAAGLLLATGLYGSTHEIDRGELRRDLRTVVVVVTLGVLLKAAFIAGLMLLFFRKPEYLVLGIAVAQIDPLSVAAMSGSSGMSQRAKSLLAIWAAFDDPMTVLLSLYFSVAALHLAGRSGVPGQAPQIGGLAAYGGTIGYNVLLCFGAFAVWRTVRWVRSRRTHPVRGDRPALAERGREPDPDRVRDATALAVVAGVVAAAAAWMLMPAVALTGLVVRTGRYRERINTAVTGAFLLAAFGLGVLLVGGVSLGPGIALGATAFAAQAFVALLILPRLLPDLSRTDRIYLAIGQQNGITAIILALALEPDFPGTVGIVGPAIVTIGVLYFTANALWARHLRCAGDAPEGAAESPPHLEPPGGPPGPQGSRSQGFSVQADIVAGANST